MMVTEPESGKGENGEGMKNSSQVSDLGSKIRSGLLKSAGRRR